MLPRRDSKPVAPNHALPRPTSGSAGRRRPLNLVANQEPFRASTIRVVKAESPEPESPPQETSPLTPSSSGLRRQSTRRDTYGTNSSVSEERTPPQSPNVTPAPPSRPDSGSAYYEPAGISEGIHAGVWPTYNKVSQEFDEKRLKQWHDDLDVLLIFAALFSAIVTAFLIRALDDLDPNYQKQSAILLYQLLNGRDPNLADISDPTIPQRPTNSAIAVNCLWFASLLTSLGASLCAIICKGWLTEYASGANPVLGLLRACKRHIRFMAFQRLNVHTLVGFLPVLLHSSVLLFFAGVAVYLRRLDERVAIVFIIMGGVFSVAYFLLIILPFVTNPPFRPYSTFLFYRLSVIIGKVVIPIVDIFAHICYLTLRYAIGAVLWSLARIVVTDGDPHRWYMQAGKILPEEYKHVHVWWASTLHDPLDEIDTSQEMQEEAILWLSQVPLDPSESKALASSLALISSSRPYRFEKPVIVFLNLVLEASFREEGQGQTSTAIDCVLVLGHMKFQSAVDRGWDRDHNVGGIPVTASVAWAAQQLTINAFREKSGNLHSEGRRSRLLTAAAWLSPMDSAEDVQLDDGEVLQIQNRSQFIQEIRNMLLRHTNGENVLDNNVLINLIHGMHACIPRSDYGRTSSILFFLPSFCNDYESLWSEDEAVLRALMTYALDLLPSPERKKPLVEREIQFDELASELVDGLVNTVHADVVTFGFWLIYRIPYAFKSRKTILLDIARIWTSTSKVVSEGHRRQLNFYAVDAFVAIAQSHVVSSGTLPKLTSHTALKLLNTGLERHSSRPMAIYAVAMVLSLGTSSQVTAFTGGIKVVPFVEAILNGKSDLEQNSTEEDTIDLHIYSTLILQKLRPIELDVEKVKALTAAMEKTIGDADTRTIDADTSPDFNRVRWKSIYLSALLFTLMPECERAERMEGLRARVRTLLRSGRLPLVPDYRQCLMPLVLPERWEPTAHGEQVFEEWIDEFPLFPLSGSVTSPKT